MSRTNKIRVSLLRAGPVGAACLALVAGTALPAASFPAAPHGPKNVIVLIGDGMSYNEIDFTSLYQHGTSNWQVAVDPAGGTIEHLPGTPSQSFEGFDLQVAMSTYSVAWGYDPALAWTDFSWNLLNPTDSAAAATSMATGVKTYDAAIGVDAAGNPVESVTERATALGKSTGVISTVPFSHATPAGFAAHDVERDNFHAITDDILASDIDVVMGAGHPWYNNDHKPLKTPVYTYLSPSAYSALTGGTTPFTYIDTRAQFEELAAADNPPDRVFGIAQVSSTLQERRSGDWFLPPYALPLNDVPDLPTMTRGALNVLDDDPEGLFLMVEGGAIDWAGHRNQPGREIEETIDFFDAVDVVIDWVNTNSSWRDTLVIVTGDHETGGLSGPGSNPSWTPLVGEAGQVPDHSWHSINHTNVLLPVFAQGAGAKELGWRVAATDPVRGEYLDNTDVANVLLKNLWGDGPGASDGNGQGVHLKG